MSEEPRSGAGGDSRPRLDRAPGERYRGGTVPGTPAELVEPAEGHGTRARGVVAAIGVAVVGAVGFAVLGSIDLGPGLLIVSAFLGWVIAIALVWGAGASWPGSGRRAAAAATIAAGTIVVGLGLLWAWSRSEGGVLPPLDYLDDRFGLLAVVDVALAAAVAAIRAR